MLGPVPLSRRELLGALGAASGSTLLWALGCGGPVRPPSTPARVSGEVRTWLRDGRRAARRRVPAVHVLAVSRQRTTAAVDVLGAGVARARRDGVVLAVRERSGRWREQVTSELTQAGIAAAVRALAGRIAPPRLARARRAAAAARPSPPRSTTARCASAASRSRGSTAS
jgi:hypothetical protein